MVKHALILAAACIMAGLTACNPHSDSKSAEAKAGTSEPGSTQADDCSILFKAALKMDSVLMRDTQVSKENADKAIKAFTDYSFYCKNDSLAPVFLIKASQVATSILNLPQAQLALERCINDFPNFRNRGAAMFLLAQLYDEPQYLNDESKARQLYDNLISVYPNSEWAANARAARQLIGKTDEEIIREFNAKNSKK